MVDGVISAAAARHGFTFADVRNQFVGHQLCAGGTKWLHALNITDITESYHPNGRRSVGRLPAGLHVRCRLTRCESEAAESFRCHRACC